MTLNAVVFMVLCWGFVLSLTVWSFVRVMTHTTPNGRDGDGADAEAMRTNSDSRSASRTEA